MTMTLSRVVPVMLYTIMCTTHVRSQSCDADPDSDIKYDRTIGGAGVAPEGTSAFTTNMRGLSVDQASAGYIYASDRGHHRIQAFDKEGGFKFTIGAEGGKASSNNDGFNGAYGTTVDCAKDGLLYIADFGNHRVQVYSKDGKYQATIGGKDGPSYETGQFRNPAGISVDSGKNCDDANGYLYVIEWGNHRVQVFEKKAPFKFLKAIGVVDSSGNPTHTHNSQFSDEELKYGFASPLGVAVDSSKGGYLYVADSNNHRVKWYEKNGDYTYQGVQGGGDHSDGHLTNGQRGDSEGDFQSNFGIAVDPNDCGHVYVADTHNERVQIFTKKMEIIRVIGKNDHHGCGENNKDKCGGGETASNEEFSQTGGITVDPDGPTVFVADSGNARIQIYENERKSKCGAGLYEAGDLCKKCRSGTYAKAGAGKCKDCPAGTYAGDSGSASCTVQKPCGQGQAFKDSDTSERQCPQCKEGTFQAEKEHTEAACTAQPACDAGTSFVANSLKEERECTRCEQGSYQDEKAHKETGCKAQAKCDAGKYFATQDANSAVEAGKCYACPRGQFRAEDGHRHQKCNQFTECTDGQFLSETGDGTKDNTCSSHKECADGYYEAKAPDGDTDRECSQVGVCDKGEYVSTEATAKADLECSPCSAGTYQDTAGVRETECKPQNMCGQGEYLRIDGDSAVSAGECNACGADTYVNEEGHRLPECKPQTYCGVGEAASDDGVGNLKGGLDCSACPENTYQGSEQHRFSECSLQTACTRGELLRGADAATKGACVRCAKGGYMDFESHYEQRCKDQRSVCTSGYFLGEDSIVGLRECISTTSTTTGTSTTTTTATTTTSTTTTTTTATKTSTTTSATSTSVTTATATSTSVTTTTVYVAPVTDKADAAVALEAEAVDMAEAEVQSSQQALNKANSELDRVQKRLVKEGSTFVLADSETAEELEAALKAAVDVSFTPAEIRDIVQKKRDAILAVEQLADAEAEMVAAEASMTQAQADAANQKSTTTTVIVVAVVLIILVVGAAMYFVQSQGSSSSSSSSGGGGTGEVIAFSNPMYDSAPAPQQQQQQQQQQQPQPVYAEASASAGYMDVSGAGSGGGGGYMDVSGGQATGGYDNVAPAQENFDDGFSSDEDV